MTSKIIPTVIAGALTLKAMDKFERETRHNKNCNRKAGGKK